MKKLLLLSIALLPFAVHAQTFQTPEATQPVVPTPAAAPATLQQVPQAQAQPQRKPNAQSNLPPIDFCKVEQAKGLFRLINVYETPAGAERQSLVDFPVQFLWLNKDGIFSEVKSKTKFNKRKQVIDAAKTEARRNMRQFVVTPENGVLYLYKDQKPTASFYCGVVKREQAPYKKGDLILTPATQKSGSLYKHYRRAKIN